VVIATLRHQNTLAKRNSILAATRASLERVDRDIRSANPLCFATDAHIAMWEDFPNGYIADYSISGTSLVYTQYTPTTHPNANPSCVINNGDGSVTTYYEGTASTPKKILTDLTTLTPFSQPSVTTFDTCPTGGTAPNATTTSQASTISVLTVAVTVRPANFHHQPVSVSDCGTRLRNYLPTS
jgi:hypothetical protein